MVDRWYPEMLWLDRPWTVGFSGKLGKMGPHENILGKCQEGRKGEADEKGNLLRHICVLPVSWLLTAFLRELEWAQLTPGLLPTHPTPLPGRRHGWGNIRWSPASPPPFQYRRSKQVVLGYFCSNLLPKQSLNETQPQVFFFGSVLLPPWLIIKKQASIN